jgi:four helix bundle protein
MSDFKKLVVWQKAHAMALHTHRLAGRIRRADHAALRSQVIRAAMSVPTNIVEGCSQDSAAQFKRFLRISLNSTTELEYHLICVKDLALMEDGDLLSLLSQVVEVRKMVYGLIAHLTTRSESQAEGGTIAPV